MSKKRKKKNPNLLYEVDKDLDKRYIELLDEISLMQADIKRAEKKERKKAIKDLRRGNMLYCVEEPIDVRKRIIKQMEGNNFLDRVSETIRELKPVCLIIARLVMGLIVSILSVPAVKYRIKTETLSTMNKVYELAASVI